MAIHWCTSSINLPENVGGSWGFHSDLLIVWGFLEGYFLILVVQDCLRLCGILRDLDNSDLSSHRLIDY